jgi:hypothetical protein
MISGEAVTVSTPATTVDSDGFPATSWAVETVANVLFAPDSTADSVNVGAPDEDDTALTASFPKTFTASLRGCRVTRADGTVWRIEGDPQRYDATLTPGPWNCRAVMRRVLG